MQYRNSTGVLLFVVVAISALFFVAAVEAREADNKKDDASPSAATNAMMFQRQYRQAERLQGISSFSFFLLHLHHLLVLVLHLHLRYSLLFIVSFQFPFFFFFFF